MSQGILRLIGKPNPKSLLVNLPRSLFVPALILAASTHAAEVQLPILPQLVRGNAVVNVAPFKAVLQGRQLSLPTSTQTRKNSAVTYLFPLKVGSLTQYACTNVEFDQLQVLRGALIGKTRVRSSFFCPAPSGFVSYQFRKFNNARSRFTVVDSAGRTLTVKGTEFAWQERGKLAVVGVSEGIVEACYLGRSVTVPAGYYSASLEGQPWTKPEKIPEFFVEKVSSVGAMTEYRTNPTNRVLSSIKGEIETDQGYFWVGKGEEIELVDLAGKARSRQGSDRSTPF